MNVKIRSKANRLEYIVSSEALVTYYVLSKIGLSGPVQFRMMPTTIRNKRLTVFYRRRGRLSRYSYNN